MIKGFKGGSSQLEEGEESSKTLGRQWYLHWVLKDGGILQSREKKRKSDIRDGKKESN